VVLVRLSRPRYQFNLPSHPHPGDSTPESVSMTDARHRDGWRRSRESQSMHAPATKPALSLSTRNAGNLGPRQEHADPSLLQQLMIM
jgi:hypothetical protein